MKKFKLKYSALGYSGSLIIDHLFAFMATVLISHLMNLISKGASFAGFIMCVLIYGGICYGDLWRKGNNDRNRVNLGEIENNYFRGFFAGMIASSPGLILGVFAFLVESGFIPVHDFLGQDIFSVFNRIWHYPLGMLYDVYVNDLPLLNLVLPFFMPIIAGVAYCFGLKNISLKTYFLYKDKEVDKD